MILSLGINGVSGLFLLAVGYANRSNPGQTAQLGNLPHQVIGQVSQHYPGIIRMPFYIHLLVCFQTDRDPNIDMDRVFSLEF